MPDCVWGGTSRLCPEHLVGMAATSNLCRQFLMEEQTAAGRLRLALRDFLIALGNPDYSCKLFDSSYIRFDLPNPQSSGTASSSLQPGANWRFQDWLYGCP